MVRRRSAPPSRQKRHLGPRERHVVVLCLNQTNELKLKVEIEIYTKVTKRKESTGQNATPPKTKVGP